MRLSDQPGGRKGTKNMENIHKIIDEIKATGGELADTITALIHEGNVSRLIVKNEAGHVVVEIPVSVAAVGAVLAPEVAALGAIAALAAKFTIIVEKRPQSPILPAEPG